MIAERSGATATVIKAGVDIEEGYRAVELMKRHIARTTIPGAGAGHRRVRGLFVPTSQESQNPSRERHRRGRHC